MYGRGVAKTVISLSPEAFLFSTSVVKGVKLVPSVGSRVNLLIDTLPAKPDLKFGRGVCLDNISM